MIKHAFKCASGWVVYTNNGELFNIGKPELTRAELKLACTELDLDTEVAWQKDCDNSRVRDLTLNIAHACNLRCTYCYANAGTYNSHDQMMSPGMARRAVREMSRNGTITAVRFFGGEPLLNLDAMEAAIDELAMLGESSSMPKLGVVTNGTLVDERFLALCEKYPLTVTVSLDGPKEIHDRLRPTACGAGSHDIVVKGINALLAKVPANRLGVEITYTKMHQDMGITRQDTLYYAKSIGISKATICDYLGNDEALAPVVLKEESDLYRHKVLDQLLEDNPVTDYDALLFMGKLVQMRYTDYICPVGKSSFLVSPDGSIYPCNLLVDDNFCMGSILDPEWEDGQAFKRVQQVLEPCISKAADEACSACWYHELCSACPASGFVLSGSLHRPSLGNCGEKRHAAEDMLSFLAKASSDEKSWSALQSNLTRLCGQA